jgi:hypothetical protein
MRVTLWHGSGSHDLDSDGRPEGFGNWCDEAVTAHRPAPQ